MAVLTLAWNCFATGPIPINTIQSGTLSFVTNAASPLIITNQFTSPFTYPPVVQLFLLTGFTNALPLTNTFVTTTNFATELATPTNCTVAWTATPVYTLMQWGTNSSLAAGVSTNISFPQPFTYAPVVQTQTSSTNSFFVTAVTTTNFSVTCVIFTNFNWEALGFATTPGVTTITH